MAYLDRREAKERDVTKLYYWALGTGSKSVESIIWGLSVSAQQLKPLRCKMMSTHIAMIPQRSFSSSETMVFPT